MLLLVCVLLWPLILSYPITTTAKTELLQKGPRTDAIVLFYENTTQQYAALKAGEIDLMDSPLTEEQYEDATADSNILLAHSNPPKIGVKHRIHFKCIDVTDSQLGGHNCSIQLNYFLKLSNGTVYWVQCGFDLFYKGTNCNLTVYVRQWYEIWWINVTGCSDQIIDYGLTRLGNYTNVGKPCTFTLEVGSYIKGTKIMFLGLQAKPNDKEGLDWKNATVSGQIITNPTDPLVRKNHRWTTRNTAPQLVLVGYGGGSEAEWTPDTEGWVEAYDSTTLKAGVPKWVKDNVCKTVENSNHSTGETSHNLDWEWDPKTQRGTFKYKNCSKESGMAFFLDSTRAYRKTLPGVVDMHNYGINNQYTLLNAYRADDPTAPIRIGYSSLPDMLNVLYSSNYVERKFLDQIYPHLLNPMPYNLSIDQPWVAQDWELGTWVDPKDGSEKTKVTYWIRRDVGYSTPVTGDFAGYFNAHDLEFTIWYIHAYNDSWAWNSVMNVDHTCIIDDYTVDVYYNDFNEWFLYTTGEGMPLLGPKNTLINKLCQSFTETFEVVEGEFEYELEGAVVQILNAEINGTPLYENVDFLIRTGYDTHRHNVFVLLKPLTGNITIEYYGAIPGGAEGFYLGASLGLDWMDTMYALGVHYPVIIELYESNFASLSRNSYFFLETPVLGEVDWRWEWEGTAKPRGGCFHIGILDLVKCTAAYCHRGDGEYDPLYFPGADMDGSDLGHVGILDVVTITSNYCTKFGHPPKES